MKLIFLFGQNFHPCKTDAQFCEKYLLPYFISENTLLRKFQILYVPAVSQYRRKTFFPPV